jgi:hypothetical protein
MIPPLKETPQLMEQVTQTSEATKRLKQAVENYFAHATKSNKEQTADKSGFLPSL